MFVLPLGPFAPVAPISPVEPIAPRKTRSVGRSREDLAATRPARSATAMASPTTRTALDDIKLGG